VSEEMFSPCTRYCVCQVFRKTFFVLETNSWPPAYQYTKDHTHISNLKYIGYCWLQNCAL